MELEKDESPPAHGEAGGPDRRRERLPTFSVPGALPLSTRLLWPAGLRSTLRLGFPLLPRLGLSRSAEARWRLHAPFGQQCTRLSSSLTPSLCVARYLSCQNLDGIEETGEPILHAFHLGNAERLIALKYRAKKCLVVQRLLKFPVLLAQNLVRGLQEVPLVVRHSSTSSTPSQ